MVGYPPVALRGYEAERYSEHDREEARRERELDRGREAPLELGGAADVANPFNLGWAEVS